MKIISQVKKSTIDLLLSIIVEPAFRLVLEDKRLSILRGRKECDADRRVKQTSPGAGN